ncbi:MAG TPA: HTTM domain-containing protein [Polyangiaceae bacterium]
MSAKPTFFDEEGDGYVLGLLRLLLGVLLVLQIRRLTGPALNGEYFADYFHLPILPAAFVPSEPVFFALRALQMAGAIAAVVGWFGRAGLCSAALIGLYLLLCDRLQYHNNRYALLLLAFLCAFTPCDRSFRLFKGRRHAAEPALRQGPLWARRLLMLQVAVFYLASGGGKLLDPDWRGGVTMLLRFRGMERFYERRGLPAPQWLLDTFSNLEFVELLSKGAIATELFLALGLLFARTRAAALWLGVAFHIGIELSARVELFSFLMGASYLAFVTPALGERKLEVDPASRLGRALARFLPWLDWFKRFELVRSTRGTTAPIVLVDRDGRRSAGVAALAGFARAVPLLFLLWPPLALAALVQRRRKSGARVAAE